MASLLVSRGPALTGRVLLWGTVCAALGTAARARAAVFNVAAGDVAGLVSAINQANGNGQADTIILAAGTYRIRTVNNNTDGPNGLPSIRSQITIQGAGATTTILTRTSTNATPLRLIH